MRTLNLGPNSLNFCTQYRTLCITYTSSWVENKEIEKLGFMVSSSRKKIDTFVFVLFGMNSNDLKGHEYNLPAHLQTRAPLLSRARGSQDAVILIIMCRERSKSCFWTGQEKISLWTFMTKSEMKTNICLEHNVFFQAHIILLL